MPAPEAPDQARHGTGQGALGLRVGFVGESGLRWLGSPVEAVVLEDSGEGVDPAAAGALDLLVVDPLPAGVERSELERIVERAAGAGARVVGIAGGSAAEPIWHGLADLRVGAPGGGGEAPLLAAPPPIDPGAFNPLAFRPSDVAGFAALVTDPSRGLDEGLELLASVAVDEPVVVYAPRSAALPPLPPGVAAAERWRRAPAALVRSLHSHLGVIDHSSFHGDPFERAGWLVRLAAAGVPVLAADLSAETEELLGTDLSSALQAAGLAQLLDLDERERTSVAQRRPALREHSGEARWRSICRLLSISLPERPLVSVVLATRRESWLAHGVEQVRRQSYRPRELVVVLHGDDFSEGVEQSLRGGWDGPLEIVRADPDLTLGDVLNVGVEAASGAYVTKMDDDDYYSVDHLWDLVLALDYAGADLVGKAAEFVYLEEIDVTVRQLSAAVDTRLAGGGMMARRDALVAVEGWPSLPRNEDRALVARFEAAGRGVHRIPPHGYILNRHGQDHTWRPYTDYFLFRSGRQWRGLRFDQTGIV